MLTNIQALRALASILVVLFHALPHYEAMGGDNGIITAISQWGYMGVDFFFVISGFIITHTALPKPRGSMSALMFFSHRLARIFLGYWPFLGFAIILAMIFPPLSVPSHDLFSSIFLLSTQMDRLMLPVSWSLTYELYFYTLFLGLFWVPVDIIKRLLPIAFLVLASILLVYHPPHTTTSGFFISCFLLEFIAGSVIRVYVHRLTGPHVRYLAAAIGVAAVGLGAFFTTVYPLRVTTFGVAGAALLVLAIATPGLPRKGMGSIIGMIGDCSYTIYLSHILFINLFYFTGLRDWFTKQGPGFAELGLAFLLLCCIIFSYVFYRLVELPLYRNAIVTTRRTSTVPTT